MLKADLPNNIVIDLARKAVALRPELLENWNKLVMLLFRAGQYQEAIPILLEALSRFPADAGFQLMLADSYHQTNELDLARDILLRSPPASILDRELAVYRLELMLKLNASADVFQPARDVLTLDPTNRTALVFLRQLLQKNGDIERLIPFCEKALEQEIGNTRAYFELALAQALLGRSEEARQLIDLHQFVSVTNLATPQGYANADAFRAALISEITRDPTLRPDPPHRSTRNGRQTNVGLPHAGQAAVGQILSSIKSAVEGYVANLPADLDHSFIKGRPRESRVNAWAVVYPGDGRQVSHIHQSGWLSGVYYVSAGGPTSPCGGSSKGCLVLGAMLDGIDVSPPWGIREISPIPGQLVLFPSYIPHSTVPSGSAEERICIAFDLVAE